MLSANQVARDGSPTLVLETATMKSYLHVSKLSAITIPHAIPMPVCPREIAVSAPWLLLRMEQNKLSCL